MSTVLNFLRQFSARGVFWMSGTPRCLTRPVRRQYADTPKPDSSTKQVVAQGTENEQLVRVRRARASDVPRVLRFVRENVRVAFPALGAPFPNHIIMLNDYVARALSQGHSMLAEQQETRRGWPQILGLALSTSICPWDAALLERWARCVRCPRSRHLMNFTAHCIRAPALHDKYRVHNILQVLLIVPQDKPKRSEIIQALAKNSIQRGKDVGIPLIRFDVTNEFTLCPQYWGICTFPSTGAPAVGR
ncbi:hypothetical protein evm_010963 [Chilo suppressalis]|nr:hypothetical protein evm_010963 [Chilo suppressalis]